MTTHEANIDRAGDMIADAAEGKLAGDAGWAAWTMIVGWTDLCPRDVSAADWANCQRQYRVLSGQLREILSNQ